MSIETAPAALSVLAGKSVLVTGGTGFVGQRLVSALNAARARVRVFTRQEAVEARESRASVVTGDLARPETLGFACRQMHTVFHLAGYAHATDNEGAEPEAQHRRVTVEGTRALVDAAISAKVECLVFVSSVKAMSEGTNGCEDELCQPRPTSAYGRAKREAEEIVLTAGACSAMFCVAAWQEAGYGKGFRLPGQVELFVRLDLVGIEVIL